jgi:hypothetical protein
VELSTSEKYDSSELSGKMSSMRTRSRTERPAMVLIKHSTSNLLRQGTASTTKYEFACGDINAVLDSLPCLTGYTNINFFAWLVSYSFQLAKRSERIGGGPQTKNLVGLLESRTRVGVADGWCSSEIGGLKGTAVRSSGVTVSINQLPTA